MRNRSSPLIGLGIVVSLVLAGLVSAYASSAPDGLEKVAEDHGFLQTAQDSAVAGSPLADYGTAGVADERLSVAVAGVVGVLITALIGFALFWLVAGRGKASAGVDRAKSGG